ncbi:MAG: hypothetical protein R2856_07405 [Caldilineaceae bacterium]
MAEIKTFAEQCAVGGPIIHLGATSMDVLDNVDALRLRAALDLLIGKLEAVLRSWPPASRAAPTRPPSPSPTSSPPNPPPWAIASPNTARICSPISANCAACATTSAARG